MTDPAVMHALYHLADYPVLASLARTRTAATRLDGRACLHLYKDALCAIDWMVVSSTEKDLMRRLGLFAICPSCGAAALVRDTRDHAATRSDGQPVTIKGLVGDYCSACGEVILDAMEGQRYMHAMRREDEQ